jgi:hypothetical protein
VADFIMASSTDTSSNFGIQTSCAGYGHAAPLYTYGRLSNAQPAALAEHFVNGLTYRPTTLSDINHETSARAILRSVLE